MRENVYIIFAMFLLLPLGAEAQQNIDFRISKVVSPIINSDNSVTFYIEAPQAKTMTVIGDWCDDSAGKIMKKGKRYLDIYYRYSVIGDVHLSLCHGRCNNH